MVLSRRDFIKFTVMSTAALSFRGTAVTAEPRNGIPLDGKSSHAIRLGGPIFNEINDDPVEWIKAHQEWGYSAAYCPVDADAPEEYKAAGNYVREVAKRNNIGIK